MIAIYVLICHSQWNLQSRGANVAEVAWFTEGRWPVIIIFSWNHCPSHDSKIRVCGPLLRDIYLGQLYIYVTFYLVGIKSS